MDFLPEAIRRLCDFRLIREDADEETLLAAKVAICHAFGHVNIEASDIRQAMATVIAEAPLEVPPQPPLPLLAVKTQEPDEQLIVETAKLKPHDVSQGVHAEVSRNATSAADDPATNPANPPSQRPIAAAASCEARKPIAAAASSEARSSGSCRDVEKRHATKTGGYQQIPPTPFISLDSSADERTSPRARKNASTLAGNSPASASTAVSAAHQPAKWVAIILHDTYNKAAKKALMALFPAVVDVWMTVGLNARYNFARRHAKLQEKYPTASCLYIVHSSQAPSLATFLIDQKGKDCTRPLVIFGASPAAFRKKDPAFPLPFVCGGSASKLDIPKMQDTLKRWFARENQAVKGDSAIARSASSFRSCGPQTSVADSLLSTADADVLDECVGKDAEGEPKRYGKDDTVRRQSISAFAPQPTERETAKKILTDSKSMSSSASPLVGDDAIARGTVAKKVETYLVEAREHAWEGVLETRDVDSCEARRVIQGSEGNKVAGDTETEETRKTRERGTDDNTRDGVATRPVKEEPAADKEMERAREETKERDNQGDTVDEEARASGKRSVKNVKMELIEKSGGRDNQQIGTVMEEAPKPCQEKSVESNEEAKRSWAGTEERSDMVDEAVGTMASDPGNEKSVDSVKTVPGREKLGKRDDQQIDAGEEKAPTLCRAESVENMETVPASEKSGENGDKVNDATETMAPELGKEQSPTDERANPARDESGEHGDKVGDAAARRASEPGAEESHKDKKTNPTRDDSGERGDEVDDTTTTMPPELGEEQPPSYEITNPTREDSGERGDTVDDVAATRASEPGAEESLKDKKTKPTSEKSGERGDEVDDATTTMPPELRKEQSPTDEITNPTREDSGERGDKVDDVAATRTSEPGAEESVKDKNTEHTKEKSAERDGTRDDVAVGKAPELGQELGNVNEGASEPGPGQSMKDTTRVECTGVETDQRGDEDIAAEGKAPKHGEDKALNSNSEVEPRESTHETPKQRVGKDHVAVKTEAVAAEHGTEAENQAGNEAERGSEKSGDHASDKSTAQDDSASLKRGRIDDEQDENESAKQPRAEPPTIAPVPPPEMAEKQVGEKRPREGDAVGEESSVSKRIIPTAAMDSAERARCRDVARDPAGTHYDLLNVPLTCTPDDLKFNYRRLARLLHQNRGGADQHGEDASEILARVNVAYRLLICPNARAEYDKTLTTTGSLLANFPDDQSASLFVERYCTTNVPGQQNHVESFPSVHVHKMHERPILSYNTSSNTFLDFIMEQSLCYCYLPCEPLEPAVTKILLSGEPAALAKCKELLAAAIKKWNMQDTGRPYDKDGLYLDYFASKEFMELCAKDKRDNAKERICASLQQSGHLELLEDIRLVYTDRTRGICFDLVPSLKNDPRFHRTGAEITIELQSLFWWKGRLMFGHDAPKSYSNWDFLNWCEIVVFPTDLTKINRIHTPEPPAKEDMEAKLRQFMSESPPTQVGEYCIDFQLGKCVRGEACIFSHQVPATAPGTLCYNFQKRLGCRDGENCKFLHLKGNESPLQAIVYAESTLPLLHLIAQSRAFVSPLKHTVKRLFDNQRFQETLNSARPLDKADFLATFFINARAELNELSFRLDPIVDFLIRFEFAASKDQTLRQLRAVLLSLASSIIAGKNAEVPWSNVASDFPNSSWASIRKVIFPPNVAWTDSEWLQSTSFVRAIFSMTFRSFQTGLTCSKDGLSTSLIDPTASAQRTAAVDITMRRASAQMLQQQCQQQAPQRPLPPQQPQQQRQQLATWGVFLGEFAKTADKKKDVVDLVTEALYKYQAPSVPLVQIAILPMKLNLDDVACNRSWFEARGQYFDMKSQTRDELREAFPMAKSVSGCAAAGSAAEWHVSLNPHIRRAMEVTEKEDKLRTQRKQAVEEWEPVVKRGEMVSSVKSAVDACIMLYFHSKSEKQNSALPSVESLVSKICAARMENGKVKQGLPNLTPFTALDVLGYITAIQARLAKTKGEIDWTPHLNFLITLVKQAGDMMKPNAQDHAKYSIMFCGRLLDALAEAPFSTMVNEVLYKATLLEVTGCVINRMAMEVSYKSMRTGGLRRFAKVAKWVSSLPSTLSFKLAGTQWKEKWMALFTSMAKETRIMLNQTDFLRVNWQVDSPELWDLETLIKLAEAFERASDHCDVTDEIPGVKEGCEHLCRQIGGVLPDCVKDKSGSAKRTQELFIQAAKAFMGKKIVSSKGRAELYGAVCAGAKNLQASSQTKWSTDGIASLFMVFVDTQTGSCARDFAELLERDQAFLELIKEKSETDVNSILACLLLDFTREETGKECITPRKKLFSQCAGNPEVLSKIMTTKTFANYISRAPLDMTLELIDMYQTRGEISFLRPQLLPHRLVALLAVRYAKELNRTDETWPHTTKILKVFHGSLPECPKLSLLVVTTGLRDMAKVSKVVADDIFPFVDRIRAQIASNKLVHSDRWPQDTALLTLQHEFVKIASCSPTGISSISSVLKELSDRCPSELNAFGPQPVEALAMLSSEFRVMRGEVKLMPFSSMMMDWVKFSDSLWSKANPAKKTGPAQPAPSPVWRTVRRVEVTSESKRNDSHMLALRGYYRAKNPTDKHNGAFVFEHEDDLGKPATERRALYYDTAEGFRGWWFGEGVGTDKVWAFRPGEAASDGLPPNNKWKVPWDGEADPTFEVVSRFHAALMV